MCCEELDATSMEDLAQKCVPKPLRKGKRRTATRTDQNAEAVLAANANQFRVACSGPPPRAHSPPPLPNRPFSASLSFLPPGSRSGTPLKGARDLGTVRQGTPVKGCECTGTIRQGTPTKNARECLKAAR